ncbi:MAG: hypothetical protein OSB09_08010 [Planctomycetota bacterium]|nr:hypothetical protein [Planctomycetota bacterium]
MTHHLRQFPTLGRCIALAMVALLTTLSSAGAAEAVESAGKINKLSKPTPVVKGEEVSQRSSVFLGPMEKSSEIRITDMETARSIQTKTDEDGKYAIEKNITNTVIHVSARGKVFDLRRGRMSDQEVLLSAIAVAREGSPPPQVNILTTLVAVRANALAGQASRGPYARIVMPSVIEQAQLEINDALAIAMPRMRRDDTHLASEKDPRDDGSMGQVQLMHVSMVVSEAAAARGANGLTSLLDDMASEMATLGRFKSSTVQELRAAENNMNAIRLLRTLQEEYGFGQACAVHYQ